MHLLCFGRSMHCTTIQQPHLPSRSSFIQVYLIQCLPCAAPGGCNDGLQPLASACWPPVQPSRGADARSVPQALSSAGPNLAEQALEVAVASDSPQQLNSAIHAAVRALGSGIAGTASQSQVWTLHSLYIECQYDMVSAPCPLSAGQEIHAQQLHLRTQAATS